MRWWVLFLWLGLASGVHATSVIEKQLREQRSALKGLEDELKNRRQQLKAMESEENGVLNTLSLLDQNLGQTRDYVRQLHAMETTMSASVVEIRSELDSIEKDIGLKQDAMRIRIRQLYMQGRQSEMEQLWVLLRQKENADRYIYQVRRLLEDDQDRVQKLSQSQADLHERQALLQSRLDELSRLRKHKQHEENGLQSQIQNQQSALDNLRHDKDLQQKALEEYEKNQKMMIALIQNLENRRKQEEAAREAERKRKGTKAPAKPVSIAAVGPKCVPLKGEVISEFGMHEHPVLHTMTKNLGIEIRANRGDPVKAAAAGKVVAVTHIGGRGQAVIIEHGDAFYSVYGHLRSINVQEGQEVRNCQEIGEAGDEESLNGPKLYFQISQGVHTIDPVEWLKGSK